MANPFDYRLYDPLKFDIEPYVGILGRSSNTEESDASSATAIKTTRAASAMTEGSDTTTSASTIRISAASSMTEGVDTSSATAINTTRANSSLTEDADTVSATSTIADAVPSGNVSVTEANDIVSSKALVYKKYVAPVRDGDFYYTPTSGGNTVQFQPGESIILSIFTDTPSVSEYITESTDFINSNSFDIINGYSDISNNNILVCSKHFTTTTTITFTPKQYFVYHFVRLKHTNLSNVDVKIQQFNTATNPPRLRVDESIYSDSSVSFSSITYYTDTPSSTSITSYPLVFPATFENAIVNANYSLYGFTSGYYNIDFEYIDPANTVYFGMRLNAIPQVSWDTEFIDDGTSRYLQSTSYPSGQGFTISIAYKHDFEYRLISSEIVEQDDILVAANFTSDVIVTEENDTLTSTIFGPYQRLKPGQVIVEPTQTRSLINSATKQAGDILTIVFSDDTGNSSFYSNIDSYLNSSGIDSNLNRVIYGVAQDNVSSSNIQVRAISYEYVDPLYNIPITTLPHNAVFMLTRNYFVGVGGLYNVSSGGGFGSLSYINFINRDWDGTTSGSDYRSGIDLDSSVLGNILYYTFQQSYSPKDPSDVVTLNPSIHYTGLSLHYTSNPGVFWSVKSAYTITGSQTLIGNGWYEETRGADRTYEMQGPQITGSVSGSLSSIGIFIYLQEDELIKVASSALTEDNDTLYAVNQNFASSTLIEDDDTILFESVKIVIGVEQTEQDDIVVSHGYYYVSPPFNVSTQYIGYSVTLNGNPINFPAGVQTGDLLIAITPESEFGFDNIWPDWYYENSRYKLARYSPTLTTPPLSGASIMYILAFRGISYSTTNFPFIGEVITVSGNTIYYPQLLSRGASDTLTNSALIETRYFNSVMFTDEASRDDFVAELGSRVIFNVHDADYSGYYIVGFLNDETNEPAQTIVPPYVSVESYTETLIGSYSAVRTFSAMFLPESATLPLGSSRAELVEEDDQLIRGAPILARMIEQDDFVRESYGYHFVPADLVGPTLIQSGYIPANNLSSITLNEDELLIVLVDSTQSTIDGGGFFNYAPTAWSNSNGWDFYTPNIAYIHYNRTVGGIFETLPDNLTTLNGVYVLKYANVEDNGDDVFVDPNGTNGSIADIGIPIDYLVMDEGYELDANPANNLLRINSKAVRINLIDFVDNSLGVVPADLEIAPVGSVNIISGSMSGGTDRLFSIDEIPIAVSSGGVYIVTDGGFTTFGSSVGGELFEYFSILFPAAKVYAAGKDCRVEVVEEDDITTVGSLIYSRNTEEDDIISEAHGYKYDPLILTSIEHVNTETVGVTTTFTISSDTYSVGDLIFVYFTPNNSTFGSAETVMQDFDAAYPEFSRYSASFFTSYNYAMAYYMLFDGVTKTYTLTSPIHTTIISYRGVFVPDFNLLGFIHDSIEFSSDPGVNSYNNYAYIEINDASLPKYQKARLNLMYGTQITFATYYQNSTSSSYASSLFTVFGNNEKLYEVENPSGFDYYTTFIREKKFPLVVFDYDQTPPESWASVSVNSTTVSLSPSADAASYGNMLLIPEEVVFINNRAELIEDSDTVAAVVEKGGNNSNVSITEADDSIASTSLVYIAATISAVEQTDSIATTAAIRITSSATLTEANDSVASTSVALLKSAAIITEADDSVASTSLITLKASVSITEESDSVSSVSSGNKPLYADIQEANDSVASTSLITLKANASISESDDLSNSGSAILARASASITEADDSSSSSSAIAIKAASSNTEANDAISATSAIAIKSSFTATEADDSIVSASAIAIKAASSNTEANDSVASASAIRIAATGVTAEDGDTVTTTATISIRASGANVEANDTIAFATRILVQGQSANIENDDAISATSIAQIKASASISEDNDSVTSQFVIVTYADLAITEANDTASAQIVIVTRASTNIVEDSDSIASTATIEIKAYEDGFEEDDIVSISSTLLVASNSDLQELDDVSEAFYLITTRSYLDVNEELDVLESDTQIRSVANFIVQEANDNVLIATRSYIPGDLQVYYAQALNGHFNVVGISAYEKVLSDNSYVRINIKKD